MMDYDNEEWDESLAPDYGNNRYSNAYGDYSGGYGPGGGFGAREGFGLGRGYGPNGPRGKSWGFPPPPPPPPHLMMGRGFGSKGPPFRKPSINDRAIKYLMRCGVSKENLKNLPRDLLAAIEPEYCGLCGHSFDSFATSRIHYISKNHLKAQKKWLTHNSEMLYNNSAQLPFKARELYCELCDIHITSKSHSDSHYSGKAHRAVVEGRKNPKNPFLLQPAMKNRLDQLIRREKKHLKAADESEGKQVPDEKLEESKPLPPELYCSICKTSVTCTEQMTMHMNGKKHLTKEKSHILRMMKATTSITQENTGSTVEQLQNEDAPGGNGAKEQYGVSTQQHEGQQFAGPLEQSVGATVPEEQNYDWGNGSGSWE